MKIRLFNEGVLENKCSRCGNDGTWMGEKLVLQLDHVNGKSNDNRLENLRILCPNCHTQTETYAGKGSKKKPVPLFGTNRKVTKDVKDHFINCRKQDRPPLETLKRETEELGFSATGRKYGVSDNAIRKWIKVYESYGF